MCKCFREFINKERTKSERNWLILKSNLILLGCVVLFVFLFWFSGSWFFAGSVETFGPLHNYIFIWVPVGIATMAAWNALVSSIIASNSFDAAKESLNLTRESLELTRATTRPFLNVDQFGVNWSRNDGQPTSVEEFIFGLCNMGSFPADQVSVLMKVSKNNMDNQQHLLLDSEEIPTICFPSDEIHNRHFRKVDEKEKLEVELEGELKVRIEIEYKNKLTQQTHKTNRSYLVLYNPTARCDPTKLPKEDYWD